MGKTRRATPKVELVTPFPAYAVPMAWGWVEPSLRLLADDFAMQSIDGLIAAFAAMEERGGKTWGVLRDGRLCGWLGFEPVNKVSGIGHCFFAKWGLGRETTDAAVRLALKEIFALGFERVSCPTLAQNAGVCALLKRVGMSRDAVLKSFTLCGGKLADLLIFGALKAAYGITDGTGEFAGRVEQHDGRADWIAAGDERKRVFEHADLHSDANGSPDGDGAGAPELHHERAESDAGDDGGNGCDQQGLRGERKPTRTKPRKPGVRKQRSQRDSGAANRNRESGQRGKSGKQSPGECAAAAVTSPGIG
jgi:RimJ/RimL family protein N-acetyltransferase